jgi:hypothetical protein
MGIAELNETGAFGVFNHAAFERHRPQLVDLSAARPHRICSLAYWGAHHTGTSGLNKTARMVNCCLFFED